MSDKVERVICMTTEQSVTTSKPKRRWLRFSLRWLMSIVLIVSLPLGWFATKIRIQREAVRAFRERGGIVLHDYNRWADPRPSGFKWLWNLLGDDLFFEVSVVNLDDLPVTDAELVYLRPLKHVRYLHLSNTRVTDAGLEHLRGLTQLRMLALSCPQVTDAGLKHLRGLTQLQWLLLDSTHVTAAGVAELQNALPNCEIVR